MSLSINNVITVTMLTSIRGIASVNTSNLGLITDEVPIPTDYGVYRLYKEPLSVEQDFGSNADVTRMAQIIFSQSPSILTGGGSLIIIPRLQSAAAARAVLQGDSLVNFLNMTADDYTINVAVDSGIAVDVSVGEIDTTDITTIQDSLNSEDAADKDVYFRVTGEVNAAKVSIESTTSGATSKIEIGDISSGTDLAPLLFLEGSATGADAGLERIKEAIIRTAQFVPYFGLIYNSKMTDTELTEVSQLVQALSVMQFVATNVATDITGIFNTLTNKGYTKTRMLYYSESESLALDFAAGYAGRGLCVVFTAKDTMLTMNLKEITGLDADPIFSTSTAQTRYDECQNNGVDCYSDFGVAAVSSFGKNSYFDEVYALLALTLRLKVAGFNFLRQAPFKIPQTEKGLDGLKNAYRKELALFVTNGTFAPGTWNSSVVFGNPEDHYRNIEEFGFWIYSIPITQQDQATREQRVAPTIQMAAKFSGAFHKSDVVLYSER